MCYYDLGVPNYKITYPSRTYPSTASYTNLTNHYKALVKDGLMHRLVVKALLYPEYHRRFNTQCVRLRRHHRTTSLRRRRSICTSSDLSRQDSNDDACDTSAASSINFVKYPNGRERSDKLADNQSQSSMIDHGPGVAIDCTRDIFATLETNDKHGNLGERVPLIRDSDGSLLFAHSVDCDDVGSRDSLQYYSKPVRIVIDRRDQKPKVQSVVHTSTAQMVIGGYKIDESPSNESSPPENSEMSVYNERLKRTNMACEDLVNLDTSMAIKSGGKTMELNQKYIDERHSMPTLFVGNRFNCSSLTEVFIPSYRGKMDLKPSIDRSTEADENQRNSKISVATTHSSTIDLAPIMPAPDQLSAELLYNPNGTPPDNNTPCGSPRNGKNSSEFVIKPPSMFGANKTLSKEFKMKPMTTAAIKARTTIDSSAGTKSTNEKVRPHEMKKCGCCTESPCISQRSSDSGMAGSYTIQLTPETPLPNAQNQYERNGHILPDIEQRLNGLLHSHSSHDFGHFGDQSIPFADEEDNNHDSGQYGCTEESESEPNRDSAAARNLFELSSSQDTVKRKSRCHSVEPQLLDEIESDGNDDNDENECSNSNDDDAAGQRNTNDTDEMKGAFRAGLYAHWWKKTQLPDGMLKDILRMKLGRELSSMSCQSTDSRGSGKAFPFLFGIVFCFESVFRPLTHKICV